MTTEHFDNYVNDNYDTLRSEFVEYLVSECGYSRTTAEECNDGWDVFVREAYEAEHGKYFDLIASLAQTYTEAQKVGVDVKVSVYGMDKETIKILSKKKKGDMGKNKQFTSAIIPFGFGEVLLFDKKA